MKKKLYIYSLLMLFAFAGCESFLEEVPRDIIAPENFFSSEADARQAVTGIYAILKNNSLYGQVGLDHFYDNGADIIEPNRIADFVAPIGNYVIDEAVADRSIQKMSVSDSWKDLYKIILNANVILDRIEGNDALTEAVQTDIKAEVLFLRSLCYWHITNLWGDAPYYIEALTINEIKVLGRSDKQIILDGIMQDLQYAQDNMPRRNQITESQRGRASKWCAAMIMAKIYMQEHEWQKGLSKCLEIINQSSHQLLPTYDEVFDPENEYNDEIIWSLDFAKDIVGQFEVGVPVLPGNGNWRPSLFNPRLRDEPKNSVDRAALSAALTARGESFNGTGLQVASKDFAEKFPLNDLRRPLNIMDSYLGYELNYPYMLKFMNLDLETSPRFNHSDNRLVFRLADVYLMAAECENEANGPANAYQYIEPIRKRAYATEPEWKLSGLSQQEFREAIYDERKWELAGECMRRYDLIRWGILLDVVQNLEYRFWTPNLNIKPHHVLLPIPLQELQTNPVLLESDPTNNGYR
ncbi:MULTISPECIES: RagB/SusD family nutrient uptake outer membrane protein [unclassified Saccharicrinis]|uniref:RagB/SusD family nutrient uptake outer membrane protein n=1 Tax=unclassified Saccharicrinis TaxID=2646859 RepID=UPI003D3533C3